MIPTGCSIEAIYALEGLLEVQQDTDRSRILLLLLPPAASWGVAPTTASGRRLLRRRLSEVLHCSYNVGGKDSPFSQAAPLLRQLQPRMPLFEGIVGDGRLVDKQLLLWPLLLLLGKPRRSRRHLRGLFGKLLGSIESALASYPRSPANNILRAATTQGNPGKEAAVRQRQR